MQTKPLLYGLAGFFIGGFIVSVAATTFEKPEPTNNEITMSEMTKSLENLSGDDYDKAFISHMIDHHESAVDMAKLSTRNAKHEEIKKLSDDIVRNQAAEIEQMKKWQKDWGYANTTNAEHNQH